MNHHFTRHKSILLCQNILYFVPTTLTFECIETLLFLQLYFIRLHSFKFCMVQLDAIQFFLTIYSKECRIHFWRNRPRIAILCTWLIDAFYFGIYLFVFDVILIGLSQPEGRGEGHMHYAHHITTCPPPFPGLSDRAMALIIF